MVGFNCSPKPQRIVLLRLMEYIQTLMKPIFPRHRMKQNRANYLRLYMRTWMTTGVKNTQKENNFLPKQAEITMKNTKKSGCRVGGVLKSCPYPGIGGGGGGGGGGCNVKESLKPRGSQLLLSETRTRQLDPRTIGLLDHLFVQGPRVQWSNPSLPRRHSFGSPRTPSQSWGGEITWRAKRMSAWWEAS